MHPDLGGGFGPGYRVAYGYDFVGELAYDENWILKQHPDSDPIDTCDGMFEQTMSVAPIFIYHVSE